MGICFACFNRRENRRSLAILHRKEITRLGALKIAILRGSGTNRLCNHRESRDFGALRPGEVDLFWADVRQILNCIKTLIADIAWNADSGLACGWEPWCEREVQRCHGMSLARANY